MLFRSRAPGGVTEWGLGRPGFEGVANLGKLKTELCFQERFAELVESCGALHVDVLKAEEMLARAGKLAAQRSPPPFPLGHGVSMAMGMALGAPGSAPLRVGMTSMPARGLGAGLGVGWRDDVNEMARYREVDAHAYAQAARLRLGHGLGGRGLGLGHGYPHGGMGDMYEGDWGD